MLRLGERDGCRSAGGWRLGMIRRAATLGSCSETSGLSWLEFSVSEVSDGASESGVGVTSIVGVLRWRALPERGEIHLLNGVGEEGLFSAVRSATCTGFLECSAVLEAAGADFCPGRVVAAKPLTVDCHIRFCWGT